MSSSPAVSSFFAPASDHRSSVSLAHQPKTYEWAQTHELLEGHENFDRSHPQDRALPKDAGSLTSRRAGSGVQKHSYSPSPLVMSSQASAEYMKSNPKSAAPLEPFVRDGTSDESIANGLRRAGNRWSFNGSEKLTEPKIANWDLVDEIGKLSISNGTSDGTDGTTTPSKNGVRDVLQIHETSPLETSSSDTSLESASPQNVDNLNLPSHSRGSSTDTLSSESSARSNVHLASLKTTTFSTDLTKDRPRSFSGAISDVELRRLQNIHTPSQLPESLQDRGSPLTRDASGGDSKPLSSTPSGESISGSVQPMFPSLAAYPNAQPQFMGLPAQGFASHGSSTRHDELQVDHAIQPRQQFASGNQNLGAPFVQVPANGPMRPAQPDSMQYRQHLRGVNMFQPPMQAPPTLLPSPTNFAYPGMPNAHGHHNQHLSLGNQQQMYDIMVPLDPAISRTQQTFRGGHQHSASDPASLRDAAALLLGAGIHNMQGMQFPPTPGMYPPMTMTPPVFPNQYFPGAAPQPQGVYSQDMINALNMSMPHYGGSNGVPTTPQATQQTFGGSPSPPSSAGPSANNRKLGLYKTELCRSWEEKGTCRYGPKCQFAHGEDEIRKVARHPKYKTEICRTFWVSGSCPYGKRCCFIHTELPASGTPPGAPGANVEGNIATPPTVDGRARSMSTNSDPNDAQISLLARITAKRKQEENATTPTAASVMENGGGGFQYGHKPPSGALRVDTNVETPSASKQNKSAYPTFANTSIQALSPGPVTAGPEFGRHIGVSNISVADMNQRMNGGASNNPRHSYTGSETSINFGQQPHSVSGGSSPFGILSAQTEGSTASTTPSGHGHSRSGSSSNWGSFSQKTHLGAGSSPYTHTPSPANEKAANAAAAASPWGASEYNSNTRHNDRTWS
ncbi:hypothetical protein EW145_g1717 [Phellinidium pouzarii]|uniref:C3H1-type domain-containing protein n=1 Tax=Phellinidium pouzarii TaxID=167371 RepID=A0A4S4LDG0_9AGAM|nr:hypothetical protein EW145_g1717 [Phellinidium pouzarii]